MQEGNQIVGSVGAAQERGEGGKEGGWLMVEDGCRKRPRPSLCLALLDLTLQTESRVRLSSWLRAGW